MIVGSWDHPLPHPRPVLQYVPCDVEDRIHASRGFEPRRLQEWELGSVVEGNLTALPRSPFLGLLGPPPALPRTVLGCCHRLAAWLGALKGLGRLGKTGYCLLATWVGWEGGGWGRARCHLTLYCASMGDRVEAGERRMGACDVGTKAGMGMENRRPVPVSPPQPDHSARCSEQRGNGGNSYQAATDRFTPSGRDPPIKQQASPAIIDKNED